MAKIDPDGLVRLDLNNPVFQENLLTLQKAERHAAIETLNKLRQMTWNQVYRDSGLKWEKSLVSSRRPELMLSIRCVLPKQDEQRPIVMVNLSVF
jgi:hypothetical protein